MTNRAVDKQFALLEKETWPSLSVLLCLHISALFSETLPTLQHCKNNLWQPAPRTTPTEKQWSLIQQPREPMLCSLFQSPKRALLMYFISIPVTLISCLWGQNLGCELKLCRHTTFPRMAQWFLGASHLVLLCMSPTEGPALLGHPSLKTKRTAEQRKKKWRFHFHSWRENFLKALSKQRKWAWMLGTMLKCESQMLTSGVPYES